MQDLSFPAGIKPMAPATEAQSLNHWITREVLAFYIIPLYVYVCVCVCVCARVHARSIMYDSLRPFGL